ncbi:helix-turn-helix domain-containing protein [Salinispora arenicola]|uniref:helix-turn-helix domain-containing protein n=1 Tax=Salinispora arenicola TaxID=168697 RepID=UPI0003A4E66C|nr:helix-turn-helix domain-containing protein [Salinispora arenicola]
MAVELVLGGRLAWYAETDRHAATVCTHHWPGVPNLGDIRAVDWSGVAPVCPPNSPPDRRRHLPAMPRPMVPSQRLSPSRRHLFTPRPQKGPIAVTTPGHNVTDHPSPKKGQPDNTTWTVERIRALGLITDIATAAQIFGLSRAAAYDLAKRDRFPVAVLRFGSRYRVPVAAILHALGLTIGDEQPPSRTT